MEYNLFKQNFISHKPLFSELTPYSTNNPQISMLPLSFFAWYIFWVVTRVFPVAVINRHPHDRCLVPVTIPWFQSQTDKLMRGRKKRHWHQDANIFWWILICLGGRRWGIEKISFQIFFWQLIWKAWLVYVVHGNAASPSTNLWWRRQDPQIPERLPAGDRGSRAFWQISDAGRSCAGIESLSLMAAGWQFLRGRYQST